jgi:hypothetical protein
VGAEAEAEVPKEVLSGLQYLHFPRSGMRILFHRIAMVLVPVAEAEVKAEVEALVVEEAKELVALLAYSFGITALMV